MSSAWARADLCLCASVPSLQRCLSVTLEKPAERAGKRGSRVSTRGHGAVRRRARGAVTSASGKATRGLRRRPEPGQCVPTAVRAILGNTGLPDLLSGHVPPSPSSTKSAVPGPCSAARQGPQSWSRQRAPGQAFPPYPEGGQRGTPQGGAVHSSPGNTYLSPTQRGSASALLRPPAMPGASPISCIPVLVG